MDVRHLDGADARGCALVKTSGDDARPDADAAPYGMGIGSVGIAG